MAGSALRRLVRGINTTISGSGNSISFTPNWSLDATETYDNPNTTDPFSGAMTWGTDPEINSQDQDFTITTGAITHLGALMTFTAGAPDAFGGALVKLRPTYAVGETPLLEMWTYDGATWTLRRRVQITNVSFLGTRSGEAKVFDLILSQQLAGVVSVWITMAPSSPQGTQLNNFLAIHLYGSCNEQVTTPGGNKKLPVPGYPSAVDNQPECDDLDAVEYTCPDPTGTFNYPPFVFNLNTSTLVAANFSKAVHLCPQRKGFSFYFGNIPTGGSIEVSIAVLDYPGLQFTSDLAGTMATTTQTISADGVMHWFVKPGTGFGWPAQSIARDYLPTGVHLILTFQPKGDLTVFQLLDIFLWFFMLQVISEVC